MRLGIIGCGARARHHLERKEYFESFEVVVYSDITENSAKGLLNEFGGGYATTDSDRVIADDSIDAVLIATFHDSHREYAVKAARAGKAIMLEKPMALTNEECQEIAEEVEKAGVLFTMAYFLRYFPIVQRVRREIPQPLITVGQMMCNTWSDDLWAQDPVTGGGNVLSQGCHTVDIIYYMNQSEMVSIHAYGGTMTHSNTDTIDIAVANIQFDNGSVCSWIQGDPAQCSFLSKFFMEVVGRGETATLHNRFHDCVISRKDEKPISVSAERDYADEDAEGLAQQMLDFIDCVDHNRQPVIGANLRDGVRSTAVVLSAFDSIRSGEPREIRF